MVAVIGVGGWLFLMGDGSELTDPETPAATSEQPATVTPEAEDVTDGDASISPADEVEGATAAVEDAVDDAVTAVEDAVDEAVTAAEDATNEAATALDTATDEAASAVEAARETAASAVTDATDAANDAATAASDAAEDAAEGAVETATDAATAVSDAVDQATSAAQDAVTSVTEGAEDALAAVNEAVTPDAGDAAVANADIDTELFTTDGFDYDRVVELIEGSSLRETQKENLSAALTEARDNPVVLETVLDQIKQAMDL